MWAAVCAVALITLLQPDRADAATAPDHLDPIDDGRLVAADGELLLYPDLDWRAPASAKAAWTSFTGKVGGTWRALWDLDRGVPSRIFGSGIAVPGSVKSPAAAERFARAFVREHIALLAPGASPDDFVVITNDLSAGIRSVGFAQSISGAPVVGGQLSVRFKRDRMFVVASEALPHVSVSLPATAVADDDASVRALDHIVDLYGGSPTRASVGTVEVLPLQRPVGIEYVAARRVVVDSADPLGRWDVYVSAATGEPVARRQLLSFAEATLRYRVPHRYWAGTRDNYLAPGTTVTVNGAGMTTAANGTFTWPNGSATVQSFARGPLVNVTNRAGAAASNTATVNDGGTALWDPGASEFVDAQLTTYIHSGIVKEWLKKVSPNHPFYDTQLPAFVNINDNCNAFSDGTSINFFRAGSGCGNTGRIADVVYHEFGHSMHNHSLIQGVGAWDQALSEGLSDFLSATITGEPGVGPGFFGEGTVLRHCDPQGSENTWPDDVGAAHHTGKIYCGTMFDLRKNLITYMGEDNAVDHVDVLFYESHRRASNIPTTYVEVLAIDDDDGNLDNGTPNECAINDAYTRHGMGDPDRTAAPPVAAPRITGLHVEVPIPDTSFCPFGGVLGAEIEWKVRGDASRTGTVDLEDDAGTLIGDMPSPGWGNVLLYQVRVQLEGGDVVTYPRNAADPWYQHFEGDVTELYCTDFEGTTEPTGWEHALTAGEAGEGADDWQWGEVFGVTGSGDPSNAYSGDRVYGNDLGAGNFNGTYQANKTNELTSPAVDVGGYDVVRLQYRRWLTVEDAMFDQASVKVGDQVVWSNLNDSGNTNHLDSEWVFADIDITEAVSGGSAQITFELATDGGAEFGGWTIDDFCVVAYNLPVCGNGMVEGGESCDDGNTDSGDGCDATCSSEGDSCGDGVLDPAESCDDGNTLGGDGCSSTCVLELGGDDESGGCGCKSSGGGTGTGLLVIGALLLATGRRRRRRS